MNFEKMSVIFKLIFVYIVMLCSISLSIEDSDDIYNNDKQLLFFEPNNLSVVIIYDEYLDHLQFHFTWNDSLHESLEVTLTHIPSTNTTSTHCGFEIEETIYGPDYFLGSRDELNFGCTYLITVNDSFESISFNYSIPYCVDGKCDCNNFPLPMNITVEYQRDDEFLIDWVFGNPEDEAILVNVSFISYIMENCGEFPGYPLMEPKFKFLDSNNSALIYTENNPHICLLITFTNKFGCPERYLRRLEIPEQEASPWLNVSYTFLLVILSLVIIALWYIDKCRGTIKALLISRVLNRRRRNRPNNIYHHVESTKRIETNNLLYIESEILEGDVDGFEFPRNRLNILYEIGKGAFGEVYLGEILINGLKESVAVKTLREKSSKEEVEDFRAEIDIMKKIGQHPNIVTMLKCCTLYEPFMMIMEYVPYGDLKHYLMNLRDKWKKKLINYNDEVYNGSGMYINPNSPKFDKTKKPSTSTEYTNLSTTPTPTSLDHFTFDIDQSSLLDHTELQHFALQIACGMAHLEKIPITHRDLAARNILIDGNKTLKISDFGLSRPGPYINKSHNKLPLRWMALEAIEDHIYDNKSDVWSFGVVLWEIGTLGAFPYDSITDRMLLYHLHVGKRLERPEICSDELYSLMLRCWSEDPKLRPTFEELVQQLDVNKNRVYIDFAQLNPTYVFPPTTSQHRYTKKVEDQKNNDSLKVVDDKEKYLECP